MSSGQAIKNLLNLLQNLGSFFGVVRAHDCIDTLHLRIKRIEPSGLEASVQFHVNFCFLEHWFPKTAC